MVDCFWSLYNSKEQVRVDGLRTSQIGALLKGLAVDSIHEWMVWQENTPDWRPALEVRNELFATARATPPTPPPPPTQSSVSRESEKVSVREQTVTKVNDDNVWQDDEGAKVGTVEQRADERVSKKFAVWIDGAARSSKNETIDISMGGIKLRDPLPTDLKESIDVTLIHGEGQRILLRCRGLKSDREATTTRLLIETSSRPDLLRKWILE